MAAKNKPDTNKSMKRKFNPSAKTEPINSTSKKPKLVGSKPSKIPQNKDLKKLFKPKFHKSDSNAEKKQPLTKREGRLHAKELAKARKNKRKKHYDLEQELASLWEKIRQRNIAKEARSKLISEALQKMKGKIPEIAGSHISSRVLQTCVKYCSPSERDAVFEELQPHFLSLADNTYAVHLLKKMLDNASKKQLAGFIAALHGHVASLLRHMVGSVVVEQAYQLGNATQKQGLLIELYSTELQLFKGLVSIKESRLVDVISKLGLQKASVRRHLASIIQPILEKGIVDHSIIHRVLMEYLSIADKSSEADVIQQLSGPLLVRMIHTRDGSKIGMLCVKHGSAKERKKIIKGMKGHVGKVAHDQFGSMVLICIASIVDDTKLITKVVIRELQAILKELVLDKNGRRVILQLLHPNCSRYLSPDDQAALNSYIPSLCVKEGSEVNSEIKNGEFSEEMANQKVAVVEADESTSPENLLLVEGGKKDPHIRRQELLVSSGLAESLIDVCIKNAGELLRSNFGKEVLYEPDTKSSDTEWWETQERGDQVGLPDESGQVGPRTSCCCQIIRSVSQWSAGTSQIEESIHCAYCSLIEKAEHFIYIENQFFISGLSGDEIIRNRVLEALYRRILRAYYDKKCFRVIIVIPLLPGFQGGVDDGGAASVRAIMHCQYRTICRGQNSILHKLYALLGPKAHDYISFYGLRAYGKLFEGGPVATSQVYVHSKVMIVDDSVALIGSANINDRSLLGSRDSEIGVFIEDKELVDSFMGGKPWKAGKFCLSLRLSLWSELLGLHAREVNQIVDPVIDSTYRDIWIATARTNTAIYQDVFSCVPNVIIHTRAAIRQNMASRKEKLGHTTIDLGIALQTLESNRIEMEISKRQIPRTDYRQCADILFLFLWILCAEKI